MKLSKTDLALLNNFQTINDSVIFQEGKSQKTISNGKGIIAFAELDAEFKNKFAIYRLGQFLSVINSFKEPELDFSDSNVVIKDSESSSEVEYFYSEAALVKEAPNVNLTTEPLETFEISKELLSKLKKLSNVLKSQYIKFYTKNKTLYVGTYSESENSNMKFEVKKTNNNFNVVINLENLCIMDDDYTVKVFTSPIMVLNFKPNIIPIEYYVVAEKSLSKVG